MSVVLDNLLGYWSYSEMTGTTVGDSSGSGNAGTWNGTLGSQWGYVKNDRGGIFNGTDNHVDVPNFSNLLVGLTAFSMGGWAYPTNITTNGFGGFFGLRNGDTDDCFYILQLANSGDLEMRFRNDTGVAFTHTISGKLVVNKPVFVGLSYNGSSLSAYVNDYAPTPIGASGTFKNNAEKFCMGIEGGLSGNFLGGGIGDVFFYGRALSGAEMSQIYNAGAGLFYPFLGKGRLNNNGPRPRSFAPGIAR